MTGVNTIGMHGAFYIISRKEKGRSLVQGISNLIKSLYLERKQRERMSMNELHVLRLGCSWE